MRTLQRGIMHKHCTVAASTPRERRDDCDDFEFPPVDFSEGTTNDSESEEVVTEESRHINNDDIDETNLPGLSTKKQRVA